MFILSVGCGGDGPVAPAAPSGLSALPGDSQVVVTWDEVEGANSYFVYWSLEGAPDRTSAFRVWVEEPSFLHNGLANDVTIQYAVSARTAGLESDLSEIVSATPMEDLVVLGVPGGLSASGGDAVVELAWEPVTDAEGYNIYWSTEGAPAAGGSFRARSSATSFTHEPVVNGVEIQYAVSAFLGSFEGELSTPVAATPTASDVAPEAPAALLAEARDAAVDLLWTPVSAADSYTIYFALTADVTPETGTAIDAGLTSTLEHSGLENGTTYYYVVTATLGGIEGPESPTAMATPFVPDPSAPLAEILFPPAISGSGGLDYELTVRGTASDDSEIVAVRVNGAEAVTTDDFATWSTTIMLDGTTEIVVETEDIEGNVNARADVALVGPAPGTGSSLSSGVGIALSADEVLVTDRNAGSLVSVSLTTGDRSEVAGDFVQPTGIALLAGDAYVSDTNTDVVSRVDLATGETSAFLEAGPGFGNPVYVSEGNGGELYVVDNGRDQVTEMNLTTGLTRVVTGGEVGTGPAIPNPHGLAVHPTSGLLYLGDLNADMVVEVDPASGDRTLVSSSTRGTGTDLATPRGMALNAAGTALFLADEGTDRIVQVDIATGDRTALSGGGVGSGPSLPVPYDLVVDGTRLVVVDLSRRAVMAIDIATGDRSILGDNNLGAGTDFSANSVIQHAPDGDFWVGDRALDTVFLFDPDTGDRSAVIESENGPGVRINDVSDFIVTATGSYIVDSSRNTIFRVDMTDASREIIQRGAQYVALAESAGELFAVDSAFDRVDVFAADGSVRTFAGGTAGTGVGFETPSAIAEMGGEWFIGDNGVDDVIRVDAAGERTRLSSGPPMGAALDVELDDAEELAIYSQLTSIHRLNRTTGERVVVSGDGVGVDAEYRRINDLDVDWTNGVIYAVDRDADRVFAVDVATGDATLVSGGGVGAGTSFQYPQYIAHDAGNARLLVVDPANNRDAVFAVDIATGDRTVLSDASTGLGTTFNAPGAIALSDDGSMAYMSDTGRDVIFSIDLATGDRTIVSGGGVGSGTGMANPGGIEVLSGDQLAVFCHGNQRIIEIDLTTGNRTATPSLFPLQPWAGALLASGEYFFASTTGAGLYRVDFETGAWVSDDGSFRSITGMAPDGAGDLLVVDSLARSLVRVDVGDGARSVVANRDTGRGPVLASPQSVVLAASGVFAYLALERSVMAVDIESGDRVFVSN